VKCIEISSNFKYK